MTYKIIYEDNHSAEDTNVLYSGLAAHAKKVGMQPIETFSYLLPERNGFQKDAVFYFLRKNI